MTKLALVTGASSGIGRELARHHAAQGGDLILTARRAPELAALKAEVEAAHGIKAEVIALDLGAAGGAEALVARVRALGQPLDILINNAGFGGAGLHVQRALAAEQAMLDLNVRALVTLAHEFGAEMAQRGTGRILNIGSTAGFAPGPNQAVYFATKAFVNSFSQALDHELRPRGVTCTLLAPGYVETGFADVADMRGTPMVKAGGRDAAGTAKIGYAAMQRGDLIAFDRKALGFALARILPLMPRRLVLSIVGRSQARR